MTNPEDGLRRLADVAERERQRAGAIAQINVTIHAYRQWVRRANDLLLNPTEAWADAAPVHYPSARDGAVARYHRESGLLLLVNGGALVTCYALAGEPADEREYIHKQVTDL